MFYRPQKECDGRVRATNRTGLAAAASKVGAKTEVPDAGTRCTESQVYRRVGEVFGVRVRSAGVGYAVTLTRNNA